MTNGTTVAFARTWPIGSRPTIPAIISSGFSSIHFLAHLALEVSINCRAWSAGFAIDRIIIIGVGTSKSLHWRVFTARTSIANTLSKSRWDTTETSCTDIIVARWVLTGWTDITTILYFAISTRLLLNPKGRRRARVEIVLARKGFYKGNTNITSWAKSCITIDYVAIWTIITFVDTTFIVTHSTTCLRI